MKALQDSYREFVDFDPLDVSREWEEDWKRYVFGPLGPSYQDIGRLAAKDEENVTLWKYTSHTTPALPFPPLPPMFIPTWSPADNCKLLQLKHAQDERLHVTCHTNGAGGNQVFESRGFPIHRA